MDDSTRRRFLRMSGIAGTIGFAGCSQLTGGSDVKDSDGDGVIDSEDYAPRDASVQRAEQVQGATPSTTTTEEQTPTETVTESQQPTETETETQSPTETPQNAVGFTDDFDYSATALTEHGWTVDGDFSIQSSRVTANYDGHHFLTRPLPYQYGTLQLNGVKNNSSGRGLKIQLVTNPEAGKDQYLGYRLNIGQIPDGIGRDPNTVDLYILDNNDDQDSSINSDYTNDGEFHDYELSWTATGEFQLKVDGDILGTMTDRTYINNLSHLVLRFDGGNQYIDQIRQTN